MKKAFVALAWCVCLLSVLLAGCAAPSSGASSAPAGSGLAPANSPAATGTETVEISMFINQPEYADAINALIEEYKTVAPHVTINYETTQNDYPTLLKAKLNAGEVPDIFSSTSGKEIDLYKEYSLDLTGQPLLDTMLPAVAENMKSMEDGAGVYGFAIKGNFFGILYNKDIFAEAGVEKYPETFAELEAACEKIAAAGYTPFTSGYGEWWVYKHLFMPYIGAASDDPVGLISQFEKGETTLADHPLLYDDFFRYVDLVQKYGDQKPLETDLSAEIAAFANGKAAIVSGQGAWVEADVLRINPDINIGFNGYPISDDPAECRVVTGADQALRVSNSSAHTQEVLDFVNWWYTSDYGIAWFTDVAGVVPPVKTDAQSEFEVIKQGTVLVEEKGSAPLTVIYSTDSFHTAFGEAMQAYVGGAADKDATCALIEAKWMELDGPK